MNYSISSNPPLFQRWIALGDKIKRLNGIIQNDMIVSAEQLEEWKNEVHKAISETAEIGNLTWNHATSVNIGTRTE